MEEQKRRCGGCGELIVPLMTVAKPPHWKREVCPHCNWHMGFVKKPASDKQKRPASHRELVARYSRGHCELCLRSEGELSAAGRHLVGHHVIEFADGGDSTRENVWIVCDSCHSLIHWMRTHHGRNVVEEVATCG